MRALRADRPEPGASRTYLSPSLLMTRSCLDVAGCGVCGTDLHTLAGGNPLVRFPAYRATSSAAR